MQPQDKCLPTILVITLSSGENEIEANIASVRAQRHVAVDQVILSGLSNVEAHQKLYETIMRESRNFDYFFKLDADMVFSDAFSLRRIVDAFRSDPNLDHYHGPVFDHPSRSNIMGFHAYSKNARWVFPLDPLFPDPYPNVPGRRIVSKDLAIPIVEHMPNPSLEQAYLFGLHRSLKVKQADRKRPKAGPAIFQLRLMSMVFSAYKVDRDAARSAILVGFVEGMESQHTALVRKEAQLMSAPIGDGVTASFEAVMKRAEGYFDPRRCLFWSTRARYVWLRAGLEGAREPRRLVRSVANRLRRLAG